MRSTLTTLFALALFAATANAAAIYEPFDYEAGSLNGAAGGDGLNAWSINQTVNVATEDMSYGNLPHTGGQANVGDGSGTDAWATTTSALGDAGLLDDGATLWFSLMYSKASGGGSNEHGGFAFGTERVDAAYNGARMNTGYGLGFYSKNNSVNVATWNNGGSSNGGSLSFDYNESVLVVGQIVWGATANDDETITLYVVDPSDLATLGSGVTKTFAGGFDQTALDTVSFTKRNSGTPGTAIVDEIRFGASYDEVIGVPEPASLALFGIGGLMMIRRRKA